MYSCFLTQSSRWLSCHSLQCILILAFFAQLSPLALRSQEDSKPTTMPLCIGTERTPCTSSMVSATSKNCTACIHGSLPKKFVSEKLKSEHLWSSQFQPSQVPSLSGLPGLASPQGNQRYFDRWTIHGYFQHCRNYQAANTDGRPFFGSSCDVIMGHRVLANDHTIKSSGKSCFNWKWRTKNEMDDRPDSKTHGYTTYRQHIW